MTEIMGQKPASAYQSPYTPKASASTIQATGLDAALQANQSQPQSLTSLSSGMLGSNGNPMGSSTKVGSGVANSAVPSFSNTPGAKSPTLPASPVATSNPVGKDMNELTKSPTQLSGLSATSSPATATTPKINEFGNDVTEANRINDLAKKMEEERLAKYGINSALPASPAPVTAQSTNPFGNTPIGQQMFANLANQSLGKDYSGLAGIGAMMGGTDGLPSGNFGDRAKRNKILNERGQQYLNSLGATQTV